MDYSLSIIDSYKNEFMEYNIAVIGSKNELHIVSIVYVLYIIKF